MKIVVLVVLALAVVALATQNSFESLVNPRSGACPYGQKIYSCGRLGATKQYSACAPEDEDLQCCGCIDQAGEYVTSGSFSKLTISTPPVCYFCHVGKCVSSDLRSCYSSQLNIAFILLPIFFVIGIVLMLIGIALRKMRQRRRQVEEETMMSGYELADVEANTTLEQPQTDGYYMTTFVPVGTVQPGFMNTNPMMTNSPFPAPNNGFNPMGTSYPMFTNFQPMNSNYQ